MLNYIPVSWISRSTLKNLKQEQKNMSLNQPYNAKIRIHEIFSDVSFLGLFIT